MYCVEFEFRARRNLNGLGVYTTSRVCEVRDLEKQLCICILVRTKWIIKGAWRFGICEHNSSFQVCIQGFRELLTYVPNKNFFIRGD